MNTFKETGYFIGTMELNQENSFSSLFHLAKQIRMKLGRQGYLLDHYLSIFFDAVYHLRPQDALDDASEAADPYRKICESVLDTSERMKREPLYDKTLAAIISRLQIISHYEPLTQMSLLYIVMADEFFSDAVKNFTGKQEMALYGILDFVRLREIYEQIAQITGEPAMETLNLKLRQKFLITQQLMVFAQNFTYDVLGRLVFRDIESSKQMFQLILDEMHE